MGDSNLDPTCSNELEHTSADKPGSTLDTLSINSGYWRAATDSSIILECHNKAACRGGRTGTDTFCADGYMGACEWRLGKSHAVSSNECLP